MTKKKKPTLKSINEFEKKLKGFSQRPLINIVEDIFKDIDTIIERDQKENGKN